MPAIAFESGEELRTDFYTDGKDEEVEEDSLEYVRQRERKARRAQGPDAGDQSNEDDANNGTECDTAEFLFTQPHSDRDDAKDDEEGLRVKEVKNTGHVIGIFSVPH